jgi:hypothetical protein
MLRMIGGGPVDTDEPVARMISEATEHYAVRLPLPERLTGTQLRGLRVPVYAAVAGCSVMHNGAHAADVARTEIPDPTVELWPDATHSLPMEETAELDPEVLAFMASHDGQRADLLSRLRRVSDLELAAAGFAGCQGVLDESPGVAERGDLSVNPSFDLLESPALRRTGCSVALVRGERIDHFVDRQAQCLELASQADSVEVSLSECPVAAGGAGCRSQDTATFVEADGVDRHADNIGELADLHSAIGHCPPLSA